MYSLMVTMHLQAQGNAQFGAGHPQPLELLRIRKSPSMQAEVQVFETFAGRSAMIGFAVACVVEFATDQGLFGVLPSQDIITYISIVSAAVLGAALAGIISPRLGFQLKESVITSLTAVQRSAASVTVSCLAAAGLPCAKYKTLFFASCAVRASQQCFRLAEKLPAKYGSDIYEFWSVQLGCLWLLLKHIGHDCGSSCLWRPLLLLLYSPVASGN